MNVRAASHLLLFAATGIMGTTSSHAQAPTHREPDSFIQRQRTIDEQVRREFDAQLEDAGRTAFDWGGWYSFNAMMFDDGVESSRTLRRHDLRLWSRATFEQGAHEFYARVRLSLVDFNSGDSYDGNDDDIEGPNLERGYYRLDLARALDPYGPANPPTNLVIKAGRDLVTFGTGMSLSTPLDHVSARIDFNDFELLLLAGRTVGSTDDFDLSSTASRLRRNYYGAELTYRGFERHEPFAYVLWQRDHNSQDRYTPFQDFDYNSFYAGIGSEGELVPHVRYLAEGIMETGHGHSEFSLSENDIQAWAVRAMLEYLHPGPRRTRTSVEYLFGSGDGDRARSPTNTEGGNVGDRHDTSFIGLGYVDTGLTLAPTYSNLHMWRAGGSFFPWPEHPRMRNLEVGSDWYLFYKHHRDGAISDPTAYVQSGYVGWEMDYYANWRVTADLAWTVRFGAFFPGDAFDDRTSRTFLLVGMTWSF